MIQEDKQLLLRDLCARLPYKVKGICARTDVKNFSACELTAHLYGEMEETFNGKGKYEFIPYLRPMSSMTEEEKEEYRQFLEDIEGYAYSIDCVPQIDWLLAHHFDFRGLIEKGLALEDTEGMYKTE